MPWAVSGGREGITAPLGLLCQCAHLPGLYPREMYRPTSTRAPPLPGATLEDCSLGEEQSWLTLSRVLRPPPRRSHPLAWVASTQDWLD